MEDTGDYHLTDCRAAGRGVALGITFHFDIFNGFRVSMCGRRVLAELQNISAEQRGYVALMAAFFRLEMPYANIPESTATVMEIANRPMAYRKERCFTAFRLLEDQRQTGRDKFQECAENQIVLPPQAVELREVSDLALGLWMATVGTGCKPSTRERAAFCWDLVVSSSPSVDDVQAITNNLHYELGRPIDQPMETVEWLALAHKRPEFLEK